LFFNHIILRHDYGRLQEVISIIIKKASKIFTSNQQVGKPNCKPATGVTQASTWAYRHRYGQPAANKIHPNIQQ